MRRMPLSCLRIDTEQTAYVRIEEPTDISVCAVDFCVDILRDHAEETGRDVGKEFLKPQLNCSAFLSIVPLLC